MFASNSNAQDTLSEETLASETTFFDSELYRLQQQLLLQQDTSQTAYNLNQPPKMKPYKLFKVTQESGFQYFGNEDILLFM